MKNAATCAKNSRACRAMSFHDRNLDRKTGRTLSAEQMLARSGKRVCETIGDRFESSVRRHSYA